MTSPSKITVVFPEQSYVIDFHLYESIREALWRHRIPLSAVHVEIRDTNGIRTLMGHEISGTLEGNVTAMVNRNIRLIDIVTAKTTITEKSDSVTSYLTPNVYSQNPFNSTLVKLSETDIHEAALRALRSAVNEISEDLRNATVLVGFSGGGDSNLLLTALARSGLFPIDHIIPVMILGIPDWDQQLNQARDLATSLGFSLNIIDEHQSASLAGIDNISNALLRFQEQFPNTSIEFFGTWLLRRVLTRLCDVFGSHHVFIGGNREDTLAEALYCLWNGILPVQFPIRNIGNISFINPLYILPKRVVDAAYPSYSASNYRSRSQSFDVGRTLYYYIAYVLQEVLPGSDISFLNGIKQLANTDQYEWDMKLQDVVHKGASADLRSKWYRVIKGDGD